MKVFTVRNFVADFIQLQLHFIKNTQKSLLLHSTRPAVTFPAKKITALASTRLYCLVTEAHR